MVKSPATTAAPKDPKASPNTEWIIGYDLERKHPNRCSARSACSIIGTTGASWNLEPSISARFSAGTSI